MMVRRDDTLQALCRGYLSRLRHMAGKHGLSAWLTGMIRANADGECAATVHEVEMLSRLVDDERVTRADVPRLLGESYRECNERGDFECVKRLRRVGIYSKVSALLYADKIRKNNNKHK